MTNLSLTKIQIPGSKEAFLVLFKGKEIGIVSRYNRTSAWVAQAGVGEVATVVGTYPDKAIAIAAVATAGR